MCAVEERTCREVSEIMSDPYLVVCSILLRDIFAIEGEKLRFVTSAYAEQCVEHLERELEKHGGLQTLRIRFNETNHCVDFLGWSSG